MVYRWVFADVKDVVLKHFSRGYREGAEIKQFWSRIRYNYPKKRPVYEVLSLGIAFIRDDIIQAKTTSLALRMQILDFIMN